jgi:hypothetical protein
VIAGQLLTVVVALALLLVATGSASAAETAAVFVIEPGFVGANTSTVMAGAAPTASVLRVQVNVGAINPQVQPPPETD